jgi:LAGLIDADG endonuclease
MSENEMDNRGSKSVILNNIIVKEQRVDGSYTGNSVLRYTLMGFERNYQLKILSKQLIETRGHFLNFTFRITLHKDDLGTLDYIKNTLGVIGNVKIYGNTARFTVTSQQDIAKIIDIFSKYPLNTIKLLNFLDFKRAFELYTSSNNKTKELIQEIANIKSGMNSQRTDFQMPEGHKPRITPY